MIDASTRRQGSWMQTYTGRRFWPLDPHPEDIDIVDIAHSLAMQCRYNGHCARHYSVAEHCVLVSQLVPAEHALWGLLHDATEAYVGDMIRPLKTHMPDFQTAEQRVMEVIAGKYGLASPVMPDAVHDADSRILLDERDALMGTPAADWNVDGEPFDIPIHAWSPADAENEYLIRFSQLTGTPGGLRISHCRRRTHHEAHVCSDPFSALWCTGTPLP